MTAHKFRETHGDPSTWTTADMETYEHLAEVDKHTQAPDRERDFARCSQRWASATGYRRHQRAA